MTSPGAASSASSTARASPSGSASRPSRSSSLRTSRRPRASSARSSPTKRTLSWRSRRSPTSAPATSSSPRRPRASRSCARTREARRFRASIPRVEPIAPVGAGDVLLGGYLSERFNGADVADALRTAIGCAAASVVALGAGRFDPKEAQHSPPASRSTSSIPSRLSAAVTWIDERADAPDVGGSRPRRVGRCRATGRGNCAAVLPSGWT